MSIKILKPVTSDNSSSNPHPISGHSLLVIIGVLAFILPTVLIFGAYFFEDCQLVQNSISAYYHTVMRNFFVGTLCAVAISLFAYYGYNSTDNIIANIAGLFCIGVAFFPTSVEEPFTDCLPEIIDNGAVNTLHFISAAGLFLLLAVFSLFIFTIHGDNPSDMKLFRNRVFKTCGWLIVFCIITIAVYSFWLRGSYPAVDNARPIFYLEALALGGFSVSWLVKGGLFFKDK